MAEEEGNLGKVYVGNATVEGALTRGWFIGPYVDIPELKTNALEIAWSPSKSGDHRDTWVVNKEASFLTILFRGREIGDFIRGGPGVPQRFRILEDDTLTVTIKWPSVPDDIQKFDTLEGWRASNESPLS